MALERIFAHFKEGAPTGSGGYDPSDPATYEQTIHRIIEDAADYERSILARKREEAQRYYYGYEPSLDGESPPTSTQTFAESVQDPDATFDDVLRPESELANRSTYVSSDVRDAVMLTLPSLIRLFAASENVVNLVPRTQADVDRAHEQTNYVNYVFWQDNPGFLILHGAFKDALTVRTGFVKWWTDDEREKKHKTFANLSGPQIAMLQQQDPTAKLVDVGAPDPQTGTYDEVVFEYTVDKPIIKVMGVPPEEMRLDRYARSFQTSRFVGHERVVPIDELTAMGYERELCMEYLQSQDVHDFTTEAQLRNPGRAMSTRVGEGVLYGEYYIKIDRDGDGVAELRYICTMGEIHKIVHDVDANRVKFAHFGVDPISHTIVGDSLADYVQDIQRIKTNILRTTLDSAAESVNATTYVNELVVDLDDAVNDDNGAVRRVRGNPNDAVLIANVPFLGQQIMPLVDLLNDSLQRRTGLSDAAKGLDPKALQSSTQIGVEAIINGQQERTELMARVLAETGFKDLFLGLYNEISESPNQTRSLRINGKWSDVDTSTFDASMGVEVNSTLGKGSDSTRLMTLQTIKTTQEMIMQQFGVTNPVVGIQQYLNTITDMLDISNIKNVGRYFMTPDPATLQQIAQTPKEPDAMTVAAKAQYEKVKSETAQAMGDLQFRQAKQQQDDAFRHQKLQEDIRIQQQKVAIDAAKAGLEANQPGEPPQDKSADFAKIAADLHKHTVDAGLENQKQQLDFATDQAKIDQQRQAAAMQQETALHAAATQAQTAQHATDTQAKTARDTAAMKPKGGAT
jgi:hypothetical protein